MIPSKRLPRAFPRCSNPLAGDVLDTRPTGEEDRRGHQQKKKLPERGAPDSLGLRIPQLALNAGQ